MDIQHTFEVYKRQLDNILRQHGYGKPQVLNQFRMQFKSFSETDIAILKAFLSDSDRKWFVADLLNHVDDFPKELLSPMLYAAVNEPDPSSNNEFIKPCRRIFDYVEIQGILMDVFRNGSKDEKIGVLKALYWARPTVYTLRVYDGKDVTEKQGYDAFGWNEELKSFDYEFNFVEDKLVYEREYPRQRDAYNNQLKTMLTAFFATNDVELKYQIALTLPKEIGCYPDDLKEEAKKMLVEKSCEFNRTNPKRRWKRTAIFPLTDE